MGITVLHSQDARLLSDPYMQNANPAYPGRVGSSSSGTTPISAVPAAPVSSGGADISLESATYTQLENATMAGFNKAVPLPPLPPPPPLSASSVAGIVSASSLPPPPPAYSAGAYGGSQVLAGQTDGGIYAVKAPRWRFLYCCFFLKHTHRLEQNTISGKAASCTLQPSTRTLVWAALLSMALKASTRN